MALHVWTQPSGYNFGIYNERLTVNLPLPVVLPEMGLIRFKIISGSLPRGLKLEGSTIVGTPFEVPRTTEYRFVIRAEDGVDVADRTFLMSIEGSDEPTWLTPEGLLPVGGNNAFYIIDSSFIDFNLSAIDSDTAAGQTLNYFIASNEGELPPGLILQPNGRITGFIQPLLKTPLTGDDGSYDNGFYDKIAYDFGQRPDNGYDSYIFDMITYDFSVNNLYPRKLNRNYEFIATITDGDTVTKRQFRIYVVGDDFFRADNIIMKAGEGTYTADASYVRAPVFTTPKYLGLRRANNYQTFKIDIFEGFYNELGVVLYELAPANARMMGLVQREASSDNKAGSIYLRFTKATGVPEIGYKINFNQDFTGATNKTYTVTAVEVLGGDFYRVTLDLPLDTNIPNSLAVYLGPESKIPPGMQFDITTGEVFGVVPYQPAVTESYTFTVKATRFGESTYDEAGAVQIESSVSRRMFTVDILGEVESAINWVSPVNLGTIDVGFPSSLFVKAATTYVNPTIIYTIEDGELPPGLNLGLDGEIVGKVNQLRDQNTYRSYWKPVIQYNKKDIVKRDTESAVKAVIRRKNIATLVTEDNFSFKDSDIVKISTNELSFNFTSGVKINVDRIKLNSVASVEGTGPYRVKFNIDSQKLEPLAPRYTSLKGISAVNGAFETPVPVGVKSTSGNGVGARFLIKKSTGLVTILPLVYNYNYASLILDNNNRKDITLIDSGTGYLPGDTVVISGADLGGVDGVNDLTFTLLTGLDFRFRVNGNSNATYNGEFKAVSSTSNSITLLYDTVPGTFGSGLISQVTGPGTYDAQTQLIPLNYFSYDNKGTSKLMTATSGSLVGNPAYYRATASHVSDTVFTTENWELYNLPQAEKSPTTIDNNTTYFDAEDTDFDKTYTFTVKARDVLGYSATTNTFKLTINIPSNTYYSNITARPFLKLDQRAAFKEFVNDSRIFDPSLIYRLGDSNFGVQRKLSTLIYAGIETREAVEYISAMGNNNKPKRFKLGEVKKAVAKEPGTNNVIYEVVYVELVDPLEKGKTHLPYRIATTPSNQNVTVDNTNEFYNGPFNTVNPFWKRPIPFYASIDRTDIIAGDAGTGVKFPSSISIWRKRLREIATARRERNYLPLWMRSIQPGSYVELDYVPAVVLCYCKPGAANDILLNIKNSGFDFKLLDYTIDRYIIDAVEGYYEDKYLVFRNDRTTIA